MDSHSSVEQTIVAGEKEFGAGNYRGALALLLPLLRAKEKLSPRQELDVVDCLTDCYRFLDDEKAALPHIQRGLELRKQLHGVRSKEHAMALKGLCMVHAGLKAFPKARKAIEEALAIMEDLGLQQDEECGSMLLQLGGLDRAQGRYKEALVIYDKAKAVLAQHKEGNNYGVLLTDMGICHKELQQWSEAVACCKEDVEHTCNLQGINHPEYATTLWNLADLFANLKQYEEAIPRLEEALAIEQRVFGDQHDKLSRPPRSSPRSASLPRSPIEV
jgi:tetratricopeptide (TPR) repeat protein